MKKPGNDVNIPNHASKVRNRRVSPRVKNVSNTTIYKLTINPRFSAVAISARNSGAVTVSEPAPNPPKILANSMNP